MKVDRIILEANSWILFVASLVPFIGFVILLTSPQSIWGLINQYQLFLILPFLDCYIPGNFIDFIRELQVTLFEMSMLHVIPLPFLEQFICLLDYPHPYDEFSRNEVDSGSFIVTQVEFIKLVLIASMLHVVVLVVGALLFYFRNTKLFKATIKRLIDFFQISFYLRLFLENFILSETLAANELYRVESVETHTVSYLVALTYFGFSLVFMLFLVGFYKYSKDVSKSVLMREVFSGLKQSPLSKLYQVIFILRRLVIVFIIV